MSVPLTIILLMTIFSVPKMIPSLQTTPQIVLYKQSNFQVINYSESAAFRKLTKEWGLAYLDVSTAFSAYSTWKMRPSGLSELHS